MDHICISLKNADELPVRVKHEGQECAGKDHPDCEYRHEMGKLDVTGRVEIEGHDEFVGKEVLVDAIGEGVDQRQRGHVHLEAISTSGAVMAENAAIGVNRKLRMMPETKVENDV